MSVAAVDRWSLVSGHLCNESSKWDLKIVVVSSGLTAPQITKVGCLVIKFLL
jgi:hypothetical protein